MHNWTSATSLKRPRFLSLLLFHQVFGIEGRGLEKVLSGVIFPRFYSNFGVISGCVGTFGANECHTLCPFFHIPCRCYVGLFSVCASVLRWKNRRISKRCVNCLVLPIFFFGFALEKCSGYNAHPFVFTVGGRKPGFHYQHVCPTYAGMSRRCFFKFFFVAASTKVILFFK